MPKRPDEFWKVIVYEPFRKSERMFRGRGGRKRALEHAAIARRKNPNCTRTVVLSSIPCWSLEEEWASE